MGAWTSLLGLTCSTRATTLWASENLSTPRQILSGRYDFDYILYKYCCKTTGLVDRNKDFSLDSRVTPKFLYNIRESVQNLSSAESSREYGGFHHCRMETLEPLMEPLWRSTGVPVSGMIMHSTHSNPKVQFVHLMSHLVVSELWHWFIS